MPTIVLLLAPEFTQQYASSAVSTADAAGSWMAVPVQRERVLRAS
jgi:hypothetical protein